jgi:hypothetical protein
MQQEIAEAPSPESRIFGGRKVTRRCIAAAAFVLLLVFVANSPAQIATTSLRGVIKDPSGAVIPGAKITISNAANGQRFIATSDASGSYLFTTIPPASYTITVQANGFGNQSKIAQLLVNQPATVNFSMTLKAVSQVVNVSAAAQTLNTTDASLGSSMGNTLIQALPSETRNVPDLLSLQPGVLYLPSTPGDAGASELNPMGDSRSGAVNGVRSDQGDVTIDGVDDNDQIYGYAFTGVLRETQDSVEEFRVATQNTNADQGRTGGAQVNMVTKSGTNRFHGAAYEYNRPTLTVSNNYFNKQSELGSSLPNIPPKLIRNIFGADVGGPIRKNKLFFFANYEATRQAEDQVVSQTTAFSSYKAGNLIYLPSNGGAPVTLSPAQVATLDNGCKKQSPYGCESSQYSLGPGPNPNALDFLKSMPTANGILGGDGYNTGSYTFSSPAPLRLNTSIVRLDYTPSDKHRIFVRGSLQKDIQDGTENFPGQGPASVLEDNTKGIVAGDTWSINPNIVNDLRYGYIRQGYSSRGVGSGDYVTFRFISQPTAETRTTIKSIPVNNIVDNFNWNHGKHDFQFGVNWRLVDFNDSYDTGSFSDGSTNPYWVSGYGPNSGAVAGGFIDSYLIAYAELVGDVPEVDDQYNYQLTSATSGTVLPDGAYLNRHFRSQEFEYYLQDAWKPLPNLTITFGIRHTLLQTPWDTSGQEVTPTIDTDTWYKKREAAALQGQIYEQNLTFAPAGKYYGKPGFYPMSKDNIAPRLAVDYALGPNTTIRAGAGIYYDHFGEALVNLFNASGSFGMSSEITNAASEFSTESSPRYTGIHSIPFSNGAAVSPQPYPYTPPIGGATGFAITWGLDSRIKTPYTEAYNFSIQHHFPKGWTLETDYVGTQGRHLLQQFDIAEPVDYVDPQGGGDYYTAASKLTREVDQHNDDGLYSGNGDLVNVPAIPYFEDIFPWMANFDYDGENATTAIYNNEYSYNRLGLGGTEDIADLDFPYYAINYLGYPQPAGWQPHFWQSQFSSLYTLAGMGMSYYNALQVNLQHPFSHGFDLSVSYTYSHSIDEGSDAERSTEFSTSTALDTGILNTWKPQLNRASSDFDTRHLLTVDGVWNLPFGRGRQYLANVNRFADAFLGGWQLTGLNRTSSGLPWSLFAPGYDTNWQQSDYAVITDPKAVKVHKHFDSLGNPEYFDNATAINNGITSGSPIRLPYPGEAGERNNLRGDGIFDIDSGLNKTWKVYEGSTLKLDWQVYNVTNSVRFDPQFIGSTLSESNLGTATTLLNDPRRMQFALRYDF